MAETGAIKAGSAFVEITTKNDALLKGLSAASAKLRTWGAAVISMGKQMAAVGAIGAGAFAATLKVFSTDGDRIAKAADRLGMAAEDVSALAYAAGQSGSSLEELENSMRFLAKSGGNATVQGLLEIADQIAAVEDPSERARLAMEKFGRSGTSMIPMLLGGADGVRQLMRRAEELGLVMDGDAAQAAVVFGDNMADVWLQVRKTAFEIGSALAPALKDAVLWLQRTLKSTIDWVKENKGLIVAAGAGTLAVTGFGIALIGLGAMLKLAALAVAALALPFKSAAVAIGLTGAVVLKQTGVIGDAVEWLTSKFKAIRPILEETWAAIRDALASGDIAAAVRVAGAAAVLAWDSAMIMLGDSWEAFKADFTSGWRNITDFIAKAITTITGLFRVAWADAVEFVSKLWDKWITNISKATVEVMKFFKIIDESHANAAIDQYNSESARRQKDIKDHAQKAREEAVFDSREAFKLLDENAAADAKARNEALRQRLENSEKALRDAQAEYGAKLAERRAPAASAPAMGSAGSDYYTSITDELAKATSTRGTFNSRAMQSLQGSKQDKAAKAQEKVVDALLQMVGGQDEQKIILQRIEQNTREQMEFA